MTRPSNLPPGVSSPDGLTSEDHAWLDLQEKILDEDDAQTATIRWRSQPDLVAALKEARKILDNVEDPAVKELGGPLAALTLVVNNALNEASLQCTDCGGYYLPEEFLDHHSGKGFVDPCPAQVPEVDDALE